MSIYAGNVLGSGENPMVTLSRGELFVPIDSDKKPNTLKKLLFVLLALVVVVGGSMLVNHLYDEYTTLSVLNVTMFGESVEQLGDVPETVAYAGVDFSYELTQFEGLITGCRYTAITDHAHGKRVVKALLSRYGNPDNFDETVLLAITEADFSSIDTVTWTWDYGTWPVTYLDALEGWGSKVAGYEVHPTRRYMELTIGVLDNGTLDITICYGVRPGI